MAGWTHWPTYLGPRQLDGSYRFSVASKYTDVANANPLTGSTTLGGFDECIITDVSVQVNAGAPTKLVTSIRAQNGLAEFKLPKCSFTNPEDYAHELCDAFLPLAGTFLQISFKLYTGSGSEDVYFHIHGSVRMDEPRSSDIPIQPVSLEGYRWPLTRRV